MSHYRVRGRECIISGATATTSVEVDMGEANRLMLHHHIEGATGGYVAVFHCPISAAEAAEQTGTAISAIARAGNVVTATCAAHGMASGDYVIVSGVTGAATSFNGTFIIATVADANTFTYAQTGGNESGSATGTARWIPEIAGPTADGGLTYNVKTSNQTASYTASFGPVPRFVRVALGVGGGTHSVWIEGQAGG